MWKNWPLSLLNEDYWIRNLREYFNHFSDRIINDPGDSIEFYETAIKLVRLT